MNEETKLKSLENDGEDDEDFFDAIEAEIDDYGQYGNSYKNLSGQIKVEETLESDPGKKEDNWSDYIDLNKDETNSQPQFATISHPPEKVDSKSVSSKD